MGNNNRRPDPPAPWHQGVNRNAAAYPGVNVHQIPSAQQQQVYQQLMMSGIRPDLALMPFQMSRLQQDVLSAPLQQQTVKLKNDINLRKTSLSCSRQRDGSQAQSYGISFSFDSLVHCTIRVYFFAVETVDDRNCTVRFDQSLYAHRPLLARFPPGIGQHFMLDPNDAVPLGRFPPAQVAYQPGTLTYPVVIVLEETPLSAAASIDDPADARPAAAAALSGVGLPSSASAPTMTASAPGASFSDMQSVPNSGAAGYAREARIRSQTTFAGFVRRADGDYDLKVIKQKIQVDGFAYELQDIYGLEKGIEKEASTECVVCLTNARSRTLLPCRHMCLCAECATILRSQSNKCPVCRAHVESLLEISVLDKRPGVTDEAGSTSPATAAGGDRSGPAT